MGKVIKGLFLTGWVTANIFLAADIVKAEGDLVGSSGRLLEITMHSARSDNNRTDDQGNITLVVDSHREKYYWGTEVCRELPSLNQNHHLIETLADYLKTPRQIIIEPLYQWGEYGKKCLTGFTASYDLHHKNKHHDDDDDNGDDNGNDGKNHK